MDPATAVGLTLAVLPLIVATLENFEYTFQPITIFSRRYRKEIERFQNALIVQKVRFENECSFLLDNVTSKQGNIMMDDLKHPLWRDNDLESRLRLQLSDSHDAGIASLQLTNQILTDILKERGKFEILTEKDRGNADAEWKDVFRRLRQRSKISFSKDRLDNKLAELQDRIDGLHKLRKQIERISANKQSHIARSTDTATAYAPSFHVFQVASCTLHDVLSSLWQCESSTQHFANLSLESKADGDTSRRGTHQVHFDLAWSCPVRGVAIGSLTKPLWLSIKTCAEDQTPEALTEPAQMLHQRLESALRLPQQPTVSQGRPHSEVALSLQDLRDVPNLCHHLHRPPSSSMSSPCAGFLQKSKTFKHLIYANRNPSADGGEMKSLEDALNAAKSDPEGIPYPQKLTLAKLLALAVLRYHSTPWLVNEWGSRDIVFFGIKDFSEDSLDGPFLRTLVATKTDTNPQPITQNTANQMTSAHLRSPVRNQLLHSLGVMLVELAYNSPLHDLQKPEDDQGDPHTLYWTAIRLGDRVGRKLGPVYADAVKICLHGGFGASSSLDDVQVQNRFFHEVVRKLAKCAEAVMI